MKAPFGPGDVVVCVKEDIEYPPKLLSEGKIYVVRDVDIPDFHGNWGIEVWGFDVFFKHFRFRLYEPPKPESTPTDTKVKAKA